MATGFYSRPNPSFGYYRGGGSEIPLAGGQGSDYGPRDQGFGMLAQGVGLPVDGRPTWTPTLTYLVVLVAVELIAAGCLARFVGDFHIG